jgi:uncharacterized surface protein with fasciclin (FAS1) repeats
MNKKIKQSLIAASIATLALSSGIALAASHAGAPMGMDKPMDHSMGKSMEETKMVGGAAMYPSKDIIDNAVNSQDHTTLVAAVKAAGLVDTLKGKGPFTVFAPVNAAFAALPTGTVDTLLKPENKAALANILTYHVVAGNVDSKELGRLIKAGGGKASLSTVSGGTLTATMKGNKAIITDETGASATVTIADVRQSNGVIHVVDKVLLPK